MATSDKIESAAALQEAVFEALVSQGYIQEWASSFSAANLPPLGIEMRGQSANLEPKYRVQQVVFRALASTDFEGKRALFQRNPKDEFKNLLEIYNQLRAWLDPENFLDIPPMPATGTPSTRTLIVRYLVGGKCLTRVQQEIIRPDIKEFGDKELDMMLDIGRIVLEEQLNARLGLPWIAEEDTRARFWEGNASNVGHYFGGVVGRAIATLGATAISPFVKLPDEVTRGVGFMFAVTGRKLAEALMHRELIDNPDDYPPPDVTFEESL